MKFKPSRLVSLRFALVPLTLTFALTSAQANLIVNGGFEDTLNPAPSGIGPSDPSQSLTGWTVTANYSYIFSPGTADTTGAYNVPGDEFFKLWGPGTGVANGLVPASPEGGNFLALDGDSQFREPATQMINGLTPGKTATLSFWWAAGQQFGFDGPTTEQVQVSLGGQTFFTEIVDNPNHGFQPWRQVSFDFIPTSSSELLSFLAIGTPNSLPPFILLDGISLEQASEVPEPSSWPMIIAGGAVIAWLGRRRSKSAGRVPEV